MIISLAEPFSMGDISPGRYPHVYVTYLMVDGPNQQVSVTYAFGSMLSGGMWAPCNEVNTETRLVFAAAELAPFFLLAPTDTTTPLWDQIERAIYGELQKRVPRLAGDIVSPVAAPQAPPVAPEPAAADTPIPDPAAPSAV
jgi:hypothetical protein